MSWKASAWAKSQRLGSPAAKAILLCLADSAPEPNFFCYASQDSIARDAECSKRTVWTWLERLERWGLITRSRRHVEAGNAKKAVHGGARAADGFTLNLGVTVTDGSARLGRETRSETSADAGVGGELLLANSASRSAPSYSQSETVLLATGDAPTRNHCDTYKEEPNLEPYKGTSQSAREGARESEVVPEDRGEEAAIETRTPDDAKRTETAFYRTFKDWPGFAGSSKKRAIEIWHELSSDERSQAEARRDAYLAMRRGQGWRQAPMPSVYLGERLWIDVPDVSAGAMPPASSAPPFGPVWIAERLLRLMAGPTGKLPPLTATEEVLIRDGWDRDRIRLSKQARFGWPTVNDMDDRASSAKGIIASAEAAAMAAAMEAVPVGSATFDAWKAEHERRGWPWLPATGRMPVVYFPKGGPTALAGLARKPSQARATA